MPTPPAESAVLAYFEQLSNWGRWGDDDQLGTLNLVTSDKRRAAAALIHEGVAVSCAWDIVSDSQPDPSFRHPQRIMLLTGDNLEALHWGGEAAFSLDFLGVAYHGFTITHLDGLCHAFWAGKMYNGYPAAAVTAREGATQLGIEALQSGVVTRGVLLDVAALKGKDWLEPGEPVYPEDLEAAEERQSVRVEEGDALFLRTGWGKRKRLPKSQRPSTDGAYPGWHAACLPWFHERGVAMIGADTGNDAYPSGYQKLQHPIHSIGMVALGLWHIDNCDLEGLGAAVERLGRSAFHLSLAPLRWIGATGCPVNPIALF